MPSKQYNGFLSYSRQDGVGFVNYLRQKLADDPDGKQLKLWKDREQMEGDKDWWQQITEACDLSEYMILILTPESLKSGVCQKEWRYAREQGVCVRPVKGVSDDKIEYQLLPAGMRDAHIYDIDQEWRKFVNDLNRTCTTNRLIFMAPPMPRDYVERKDIFDVVKKQLLQKKEGGNIALSSALKGAGGFGKTTMAAAICHDEEIREHYHGGILWATVGEEGNLQREITKICHALTGEHQKIFIDEEEAARSLSEKLEQGKYLVVLDDVWNYGHVSKLVEKILTLKETALLITTRIDTVVQQTGSRECEVNEMNDEQARKFLTAGWNIQVEHQNLIRDIVSATSGWLILLKLIRSTALMMLSKGASLEETLSDLKEVYITQGLTGFDVRNSTSRNEAIDKCIGASFGFLNAEEKEKCLLLGIFPTDVEIPMEVIFSLWQMDILSGKRLLQVLDDYSLLNLDLGKKSVTFHDVLLHYYKEQLGETRRVVHRRLLDAWPDVYQLPNKYAWNYYIWHLMESSEIENATKLLQRFEWVESKLLATDINQLLKDFELFRLDSSTNLIYRALKLSTHVLITNKMLLGAQLIGRLTGLADSTIEQLVSKAKQVGKNNGYWLCPKTRSLIPPGMLVMILKGHSSVVKMVVYKREIISGSEDGTIQIWDIDKGTQICEPLKGHKEGITQLIIYDGRIISGSGDDTIRIWDVNKGTQICEPLKGHKEGITQLIIHDGRIICGSGDNTIRIWDIETGALVGKPLKGHKNMITNLVVNEGKIISGSMDNTICVWNLEKVTQIGESLKGHKGSITELLVQGGKIISGSADKTIRIWDIETGALIGKPLKGHKDVISALVINDGKIISGSWDNTIRIWDIETGAPIGEPLKGHEGGITQLLVHEGKIISVSWDFTIRIWDIETGIPIGEALKGHNDEILQLVDYDGKIISGSMDNTIRIWNLETATQIGESLKGHEAAILQLIVFDGKIISGSWDNTIRIWDIDVGLPVGEPLKGHEAEITQIIVNNGKVISGSWDNTIRVWDLETGKVLVEPLEGHERSITGLIIHGGKIITGSMDNTIRIWNLETVTQIGKSLKGHKGSITQLLVHEGKIISGSEDNTIRIWDIETGAPIGKPLKGHKEEITQLVVNDGKIISGSNDNTIRIWDIETGAPIGKPLKGHKDDITQLVVHEGKIISGSWDNTIRLWDLDTGKLLVEPLVGHEERITRLLVHEGRIISGSADNTIRVWDLDTRKLLVEPLEGHEGWITQLLVHEGRIISGSADNTIRIWETNYADSHILFEADALISCMAIEGNQIIVGDGIGKVHFLEPVGFTL